MNTIERYKDLNDELYKLFLEMSEEAYQLFLKGEYEASFKKQEECLAIFPEPKTDYGDYRTIIEDIIDDHLKLNNYSLAKEWLLKLEPCIKNQHIMSDYDFLKGKVYFENQDYETAWQCFDIVMRKKGAFHFKAADHKYLDFYKNFKK